METQIGPAESASAAVFRAVSAVTGRSPESLPPLAEVVDPDAMDGVFDSLSTRGPRSGGRVSFSYGGCRVTVEDGDRLTIDPVEMSERSEATADGPDGAERDGSDGASGPATAAERPGSRVCFVCQQPIAREPLERAQGELVHHGCRGALEGVPAVTP